jgi:hypothetical protein
VFWDCTNALKADMSGVVIGTTTSAAEEIQKSAPWARLVKAIPPCGEVMQSRERPHRQKAWALSSRPMTGTPARTVRATRTVVP